MTPDMSVLAMLDSFIYIVKGSRVIDRKARDWGKAYWLDEKLVKCDVHTVSELKRYFAHRYKVSIKRNPRFYSERIVVDPFGEWLTHPHRFIMPTVSDAMKFADMAAQGRIPPRIDIDAVVKSATRPTGPQVPPWHPSRLASTALWDHDKKGLTLNP